MNNRFLIMLLVFAGILAAAAIDHYGRFAMYAGPLYFVPLIFAGWYLERTTAIIAAVLAAGLWAMVSLEAGSPYFEPASWLTNLLLQGALFVVVTLLARWLHVNRETAHELAAVDEETGLASRHGFFERAGSVLAVCHRNGEPVTLAYLTLDADQDGQCRQVAEVLADSLRISDVAGRLEAGEFAILLPETGQAAAHVALEKVRLALDARRVHARIGAVTASPAPRDLNGMFHAADKLLHRLRAAHREELIIEGMAAPA